MTRPLHVLALSFAACVSDSDTRSDTTAAVSYLDPASAQAIIAYDRDDRTRLEPFPDDYFLISDPTMPTGARVQIPVPETSASVRGLLEAAQSATQALDGLSPLAPIVVPLPAELDPSSAPLDAEDSVAPESSIALFDVDPASPEHGQRVPFFASLHSGRETTGSVSHTLLIFSARPLRARGHYAFVITRAARTRDGRALAPSSYMQQLLSGTGATEQQQRSAERVQGVLSELAAARDPVHPDEVALLLSLSIRSMEYIADDLLSLRQQLRAASTPTFQINEVSGGSGDIAAIVSGEWRSLSFRDGSFLARGLGGRPRSTGVSAVPFTLALPSSATRAPAPIVIYQHGQPGSAEAEAPLVAQQGLAADGFAVLGFTDLLNREIAPDGVSAFVQLFLDLILLRRMPDYLSLLTLSEQLALLRLIPELERLDVLPLGRPDGRADLDPSASLSYLGISGGAQHGMGLLPFAPEISAAALSAAAGRLSSLLVRQLADPAYDTLSALIPDLTRAQLYTAIALIQMGFDDQDPQNLAHFAFRQPLQLESDARACVLLVEGIADPLVPVSSTRSGAWQLDIPQLQEAAQPIHFLASATAPLRCDPRTGAHGALFQFVPRGQPDIEPTPGCAHTEWGDNGHRCAHHAEEAVQQRRAFFKSARTGTPELIDPLH